MMSSGWLWLYFGAFLVLAELLAPGFVIFFFGLSAATVGLLWFVFGEAFDLTWQLIAFSAFSVVYLVGLRRLLKRPFSGKTTEPNADFDNEYIGRVGTVTSATKPPLAGRVEVGDAEWTAVAADPIAAGANVKVISQNNLTFKVEEMK